MVRFRYHIAVLITGAAIFFWSCENNIEKIKAFSSAENLPIVEVINLNTVFTDSGEVRYSLKAPKSFLFENEGVRFHEFPSGVEITTYDDYGHIISRISANYAKQFLREEKWEAKNNVVAVNSIGDTLKTEYLVWDRKDKRIHTDQFVTVKKPDKIITGIGFDADETMKKWKMYKIKGELYVAVGNKTDSLGVSPPSNTSPPVTPFQEPLKISK